MTERLAITHARVLLPHGLATGSVLVENGRITAVHAVPAPSLPAGTPAVNARGRLLAPGFIDLQLNGGFGLDFTTDPAHIWPVAARLPRYGVTSFLPTIITSPPALIELAQQVLAAGPPAGFAGATPLGLHLEGPFLNPARRGAHPPAYLLPPAVEAVRAWSPETAVRLVTLAPELPGALDVVRQLVARGVVVSAGHSLATLAQATAGFAAGIRYGTHLFNAMPPLHHREPGLAGALLTDERLTLGLIADGLHVHRRWLRLVWQLAGHRLTLVSDGMAAMGMADGAYRLGAGTVTVHGGRATLPDGALAGSTVTLDRSLRHLRDAAGASLVEVVGTVTAVPARLLGRADLGRIAPGCAADLVLLTDEGEVGMTIKAGRIRYRADNQTPDE